jgi:hypothetical protein
MSFGGWWSKSKRGRHAPHRRSKWLRQQQREEKRREVEQDFAERTDPHESRWLD